jgi:hypothetical protein
MVGMSAIVNVDSEKQSRTLRTLILAISTWFGCSRHLAVLLTPIAERRGFA